MAKREDRWEIVGEDGGVIGHAKSKRRADAACAGTTCKPRLAQWARLADALDALEVDPIDAREIVARYEAERVSPTQEAGDWLVGELCK